MVPVEGGDGRTIWTVRSGSESLRKRREARGVVFARLAKGARRDRFGGEETTQGGWCAAKSAALSLVLSNTGAFRFEDRDPRAVACGYRPKPPGPGASIGAGGVGGVWERL